MRGGEKEEPALASLSRQNPAGTLAPQVHANEGGRINIPAILHREAHRDASRHLRGGEVVVEVVERSSSPPLSRVKHI